MDDKREELEDREARGEGSSPGTDQSREKTPIRDELLDELLSGCAKPEDLLGPKGLLKRLTGALVSRAMEAELSHHLGYDRGEDPPTEQANRWNGIRSKTLRSDSGPIPGVMLRHLLRQCFVPASRGDHPLALLIATPS